MSGDLHTPTNAGPDPGVPGLGGTPPTFVGGPEPSEDDRPEILAGAAFAGGLLAALILKRFSRDDD